MIDTDKLRQVAADCFWPTSPVSINTIIDRLETAQTAWKNADKSCYDLTEKVIPNLREQLEAAEKERDALRNEIAYVKEVKFPRKAQAVAGAWKGKCERLEAERDALRAKIEQMEQQEPSEQDASVRKAWARFSHELHRSPDAPYPGMADAFEQHFSQPFTDRDWRAESGTWAAAWKAAKRHSAKGEEK